MILFAVLLLPGCLLQGQYRNYTLPCLAPILQNIDPAAPKNIREAFLSGPKQLAQKLEGAGASAVDFPISSPDPEAREFFEQGIALLHTLSYREAQRAFRTVVHLDPDCPMGYWGLAQAWERSPAVARLFAREARDRCDRNRPAIEQAWCGILADFYAEDSGRDLEMRSRARIRALEEMVLRFPDHGEVRAFLIRRLALDRYRAGLPVTSLLAVDSLAREWARDAPEHPSRHYRVFLWLENRPDHVLEEAAVMPGLSPRVAEVWRFAGEAHAAGGRPEVAATFNEAAIRTDFRNLSERRWMPSRAENLVSNYSALVEGLIGAGRIDEAVERAREMLRLPREAPGAVLDGERLIASALMQSGQWLRLLEALDEGTLFPESDEPRLRADRLLWKGLCLLVLERFDEAATVVETFGKLEREALVGGSSSAVEKAIAEARDAVEVLHEWLAAEEGEGPVPSRMKIELPELVKAALLERAGRDGEAFRLVSEIVSGRSHAWLPAAVHCRLAWQTGHRREALFRFDRRFRTGAALADDELVADPRLRSLARELTLPEDWTLPPEEPDMKVLPDHPDDLGPARWEPFPAEDFELPDRRGRAHSLSEFRGHPVLLFFFLGARCPFCMRQFDGFGPHWAAFEKAGIRMAAVSTDSVETMNRILESDPGMEKSFREKFPYPVLADPELEVFKRYGVFDEFEEGPMHATILIDPGGRVLWQHIGHGTFEEPAWLLDEAGRLLRIHGEESRAGGHR